MLLSENYDHDQGLIGITHRRAQVLRELADGYTEREIAARLGMSVNGVRSHVERLRSLAGCATVRELGRWWRSERERWLAAMAVAAGLPTTADHRDGPNLPQSPYDRTLGSLYTGSHNVAMHDARRLRTPRMSALSMRISFFAAIAIASFAIGAASHAFALYAGAGYYSNLKEQPGYGNEKVSSLPFPDHLVTGRAVTIITVIHIQVTYRLRGPSPTVLARLTTL